MTTAAAQGVTSRGSHVPLRHNARSEAISLRHARFLAVSPAETCACGLRAARFGSPSALGVRRRGNRVSRSGILSVVRAPRSLVFAIAIVGLLFAAIV